MCMDKICGVAMGLKFLIAGSCLLASGLGMMSAALANEIAGVMFVLAGISFAVHTLGMCPLCKCTDKKCCDDKCCK